MAIKGLSIPTFGKYTNNNGTVSYSEGKVCGHAINYSFEPNVTDDNPLYGDNMIVENDLGKFQDGTLTMNTSEIPDAVAKWLLGLHEETTSIGSGQSAKSVTTYVYDDDAVPITVGVGVIEKHQVNDVDYYKALVFSKCQPRFTSKSAETQGETVNWQTPEIEFNVQRSDASGHRWLLESELLESEAEAQAFLNTVLVVSVG